MKIIFDASSAINLINGAALSVTLNLSTHVFLIGPQARGECAAQIVEIDREIACGALNLFDDSQVSSTLFVETLALHNLGLGETECLVFAEVDPELSICCDDGRARAIAKKLIGPPRVVGSLFLLRECVRAGILSVSEAYTSFLQMRTKGAFLPDLDSGYFL